MGGFMKWRVFLHAAALVMVLGAVTQAQAGVMYKVTDLGSLPGRGAVPTAINDRGQVVGYSWPQFGGMRAFRTAPNAPINPLTDDLGVLPGGMYSKAYGINNLGQVVGWSGSDGAEMDAHAFRTGPNQPINPVTNDLGTLGGSRSFAYAINDVGEVVGESSLAGDDRPYEFWRHAFRTGPNLPINASTDDLGTLGGRSSAAYGINDAGQVAGSADTADGKSHAFRTGPDSAIVPLTDDLGTLGAWGSVANAITSSGGVAGTSGVSPEQPGAIHIFRTERNRRIDPGTDDLGAIGQGYPAVCGMNDGGDIVGWYFAPPDYDHMRAFVVLDSGLFDLNDLIEPVPDLVLYLAYDINNLGQIAVAGTYHGQLVAYRLDPVPEPSGILLFTFGLVVALRRQARTTAA
jgi:probable HAF family extracellular repeat protein